MSWIVAKSVCEALGAKLVVLNSLAENQAVGQNITRKLGTMIGLHRNPNNKSSWLWVDGSRATYSLPWNTGELNNPEGGDCVRMLPKAKGYRWKHIPCDTFHSHIPYVCETRGKSVRIILYIAPGMLNHS